MDDTDEQSGPEMYSADYVAELRRDADRRLLLAEMKTQALRAGMLDPDGLKLLDLGQVRLDDQGAVQVPDGFFEAARRDKPYLFARPGQATGSMARSPSTSPPVARNAVTMSHDEWMAARAALLRR